MNLIKNLDKCNDFSGIFDLVKSSVENTLRKRRGGLSLGLLNLPTHVGAFYQIGSNFIIMNKRLLNQITETGNKKTINAYIFHVLLHEYLHSLGYLNERLVHTLTYLISKKTFGENHPATLIAKYGIGYVFQNIARREDYDFELGRIEIVEDFENENLNYFG